MTMARRYASTPLASISHEDDGDSLSNESSLGTLPIPLTSEPQPMTQQRSNIVLFGEMGAGKSSVVNLIMGSRLAQTSSSASSCTLDASHYDITIEGQDFRVFDTVGLNEPQKLEDSDGLIRAIHKAYHLISYLCETGGINLLVLCVRGGRITDKMEQNYKLFHEFLCHKKVPVALVITHLENEENMEEWWLHNCFHFTQCGIHAVGHACITARQEFGERYYISRQAVHNLLVAHGRGIGFMHEKVSWLGELLQKLLGLVGVRPRLDSLKAKARKLREYGLSKKEIDALLIKISAVDEDLEHVRPRSPTFTLRLTSSRRNTRA